MSPRRGAAATPPSPARAQVSRAASAHSQVAAPAALARVAKRLRATSTRRADTRDPAPDSDRGPLDLTASPRTVALELVSGRGHYERVIRAVLGAHTSIWIATANVKELMVADGRAAPGRRRNLRRASYVSVLAKLDELAARGVELRLLHAEIPSRPFRAQLAHYPRLVGGDLAVRRCPRVHLKVVIVDGELLYLGSANWTGAGLGARGTGRRNFELGIVTDDAPLLDQVQSIYDRIWTGGECATCKLRDECPGPISELRWR